MKEKLSFEIKETPVLFNHNGEVITDTAHKAIITEGGKMLSVMKSSYNPMYNGDFMESVERMSEISGFDISGYNEFKSGRVVLGFLKNNSDTFNVGDHKIEDYLVLGSSHDGTWPFFIGTSTILVRCTNAFSQISKMERVRHTKSAPKKREELFQALQVYFKHRQQMYENMEKLMYVKVDESIINDAKDYILRVSAEDRMDNKISTRKLNQIELLTADMITEMEDVGYNAFGMFQGVTKYTSHTVNQKEKVFGNIFGSVAHTNKRAYEFTTALI